MTSLYPSFHGVISKSLRLADNHTTLAELLKQNGYQTAAFTDGGQVSGAFGFNQGFDTYEDEWIGIENIIPKVERWLDNHASEPFFLFIHCYDIHEPYNPPPPYNNIFHDFIYRGHLVPSSQILQAARKGDIPVSNEDLRHFIALYDGGIRYTDEKIGELLAYLRDTALYDQSLIIITSDHGEEFNEHGSFLHWQLYYDSNLHVPLIMRIPSYQKKEIRVNQLVRSIDILPTITDLTGVTCPPSVQGKSLLPLLKKKNNFFNFLGLNIFQKSKNHSPMAIAENDIGKDHLWTVITSDGYQLIDYPNLQQLFNLKSDPLAKTDILNNSRNIAEKLIIHYNHFYSTKIQHTPSGIDLDNRTRQQLAALGYIEPQEQVSNNPTDPDEDSIITILDNCPFSHNPDQEDTDGDKVGNACDSCPTIFNPGQENRDGDWVADACDDCVDTDWDGYGNAGFKNNCAEDNCPYVFNPGQEDTDKDGIGDACAAFSLDYLWLEAEDADTGEGKLEVAHHSRASQGQFIHTPNGKGSHYTPGETTGAVYSVSILQPGEYVLWGRVQAPTEGDNSFFVQVDDGFNNLWECNPGGKWHWDTVNNRGKADPVKFFLTEGIHTITLKVREDGTKLDQMVLTNDLSFIPGGVREKGKH
jgi:hypothetical protein